MQPFNNYYKNKEWLNSKDCNIYYYDNKEYKLLHLDGFPIVKQSLLRQEQQFTNIEQDLKKLGIAIASLDYSQVLLKLDNQDYGLKALKDAINNIEVDVDLSTVAKEKTLTEGIQQILDNVHKIDLSSVAKELTLTNGINSIRQDISHITIDTSDLAKEANATSNKQEILTAVAEIKSLLNVTQQEVTDLLNE